MALDFILAGFLRREYLLPPAGRPLLDVPGGNLLYAASGLRVWRESIGLLGRVGEDYPYQWRQNFQEQGFDTKGIQVLPDSLEVRTFRALSEKFEVSTSNPVSHFARRTLTFPKSLLGYQPIVETHEDPHKPHPHVPSVGDIPKGYLQASAVHLCSMDMVGQEQLLVAFKAGSADTITLDPSPSYMKPDHSNAIRRLLSGITAFFPSQEEMRALYWGKTNDLWEMAEDLSDHGCEMIVIKCGSRGQLVFDVQSKRRWEIPAYPSRVADPTGAGDSFSGGFLAGYCEYHDPVEATIHGNISASLSVEGSGAFYPLGVMPGLAEARLEVVRDLVREI